MPALPPPPNFANRTIWTGDNLDIMRGLNGASVDLIYLDPPFNSNRDYAAPVGSAAAGAAFKDTWTLSDLDVAWMGLIADERPAIYQLLLAAGLTHGSGMQSYLCMMAVRLLELRRLLKDSGSIYLHCDPTASHYLKMLMDAVFGVSNYRNEIVWRRVLGGKNDAGQYGRSSDRLLFYTLTDDNYFDPPRLSKPNEAANSSWYSKKDKHGNYASRPLFASGETGGDSGQPWRGIFPKGHWIVPRLLTRRFETETGRKLEGSVRERLEALALAGYIEFSASGNPSWRRYLHEANLPRVQDVWYDGEVKPIARTAKERLGYPTQKPLALLERIVAASSDEGDFVLDPFCGCATACVAAEKLGRQWLGIDLSAKAVELVNHRLRGFMGELFHSRLVTARSDIPRRTDISAPIHYRKNRHVLFGQQEGRCHGCQTEFPFKLFEIDHIIPRSRGGTDHLENLQLLCSHCNRIKGDRPQEYLVARLQELSG